MAQGTVGQRRCAGRTDGQTAGERQEHNVEGRESRRCEHCSVGGQLSAHTGLTFFGYEIRQTLEIQEHQLGSKERGIFTTGFNFSF